MQISVNHRNRIADFDIGGLAPDATIGELLTVVWPTASRAIVDGRLRDPNEKVSDVIRDGSEIEIDAPEQLTPSDTVANLYAVSGPHSGRVWQLGVGRYSVGEESGDAIQIDGCEGVIDVNQTGGASWDGEPFPRGVLKVGPHRLRIDTPRNDGTPHPPGARSFFNRPPRHLERTAERPIVLPKRERVTGKPRRISVIMIVLPILTGVGLALFLGRMMFLAFALMSPVMMVGNSIDDRRRRKRDTREAEETFALDLEAFEIEMSERAHRAAVQVYDTNPSVGELLYAANQRSQRLWERRVGHSDQFTAVVGYGAAVWNPPLSGLPDAEPEIPVIVKRLSALPDGPITTTLAPTRTLGVSGDRERAQALVAHVVCQLAVTHGPVDIRIAVVTDDPSAWDWIKWFPHTSSNQLSDVRLLATSEGEISALLGSVRNAPEVEGGPLVLLVVDHTDLDDDQTRIVRECLAGVGKPTAGLTIVDKPEKLPAACTEVIELGTSPRFRRPHAGLVIDTFDPVGIEPYVAHVVGLVTDLDEHLGQRALTSLEAELHFREERLRDAGATDIDDYWASIRHEPLPRLAVVVDEFATLAKELPDFMDALVDIAQRGRSLGVHMLLATQRPSGVIKEPIRANTNLRISLRVQTPADSKDVLNSNEAAALPRSKPGRGYARLGPGELVPFQTALSTVASGTTGPPVRVTPFIFAMAQPAPPPAAVGNGPSDLSRLVSAIKDAHHARGTPSPRRPWTSPLPFDLAFQDLPEVDETSTACIGLVDQPNRQRQAPWSWRPHDDGNLLLIGSAGWGPTDGLLAAATALAARSDSDETHIYGIDHGSGRLSALEALPHVGAIIPATDIDRQKRLLRHIRSEIESRRTSPGGATTILLLDGIAGFKAAFDDQELMSYRDMLQEIAAHGPQHGVFTAASADQNRVIPSALSGVLGKRLVFSLADSLEYGMVGIKGGAPDLPRGRCIDPVTQEHVQVARIDEPAIAAVAAAASLAARTPEPILSLPTHLPVTAIVDAGSIEDELWQVPIGIDDDTLSAATFALYSGDHFMVAGPNRSGRSSTLVALTTTMRKLAPDLKIIAICPRPSELRLQPSVNTVAKTISELGDLDQGDGHTLILVDDAEELDDGGVLTELIEKRTEGFTVVAAGRTDALRGAHRHWTRSIRAGRRGLILRPFDSADGDVLGVRLPRTARPFKHPGRGYLVDGGSVSLIQVAQS